MFGGAGLKPPPNINRNDPDLNLHSFQSTAQQKLNKKGRSAAALFRQSATGGGSKTTGGLPGHGSVSGPPSTGPTYIPDNDDTSQMSMSTFGNAGGASL